MAHRPDIIITKKQIISPRGIKLFAPFNRMEDISFDDTVEYDGYVYDIFDIRPLTRGDEIGAVIQIDIEKLLERGRLGTDRVSGS